MKQLSIRPIRKEDYSQVVALIKRTMMEVNIKDYDRDYLTEYVKRYDDAALAAFVESEGCHFYVAVIDGEIAACGAVAPSEEMRGAQEIRSVYVRPDFIGIGLGREMMVVLEGDSAFLSARWVVVSASITAHEFYAKLGYRYAGGEPVLVDNDHYWMEKFPKRKK